jgi:hypothetical protein
MKDFVVIKPDVKKLSLPVLLALMCALVGCAEYKEYTYREYAVSRENAYDAMRAILQAEGYEVNEVSENFVNDLPEVYMETEWNLRQTGSPYPGNDIRRKAYVKITTVQSERTRVQHQPLSDEDWEAMKEREEELDKRAELEHNRIGIAVRMERRSDIKKPLEADWFYDGPDNFEAAALMGRFESAYGRKAGAKPSAKSERIKRNQLEEGSSR